MTGGARTRVRGVAVGADHQEAGHGVVLQDDLVNDAAARAPEADRVLGRRRAQEVVHLRVDVLCVRPGVHTGAFMRPTAL